jgi:SAM-dependent methyltransferase
MCTAGEEFSRTMSMQKLQQTAHDEGHDYTAGSPHIKHLRLRTMVVEALQDAIGAIADRRGACRVLEVGAGHGTFTDHIVAAGASVQVTEMSEPSAAKLRRRFRNNKAVTVVDDPNGKAATEGDPVDVVACISVLHHIPDYLSAVAGMVDRIAPGGAFISYQDPLWYPRRTRVSRQVERVAYLSWRITQGDLRRGVATTGRRLRGSLDESNPSDMVEYHVVRNGVDEESLELLLAPSFASVGLRPYWSSQGDLAQRLGGRVLAPNTFGLVAVERAGIPDQDWVRNRSTNLR